MSATGHAKPQVTYSLTWGLSARCSTTTSPMGIIVAVSRDIFIQDIPPNIHSVEEIPDSWRPSPLPFGHAEVVAAVREIVPSADFTAPTWGQVEIPGASIEVNVSDKPQLDSFALHVRAVDQAAADQFIAQLLDRLDVRGFDPENETGLFSAPEPIRRPTLDREPATDGS
jgi:hypothetical protein